MRCEKPDRDADRVQQPPVNEAAGFVCRLTRDLPLPEVVELYRDANWLGPEAGIATVEPMLRHTFAVCAAFAPDGRLLGLMRALSDGVSDAYLLDLVVRPEWRQRGVGTAILQCLTAHLRTLGIDWIVCVGAPGTEAFYARNGVKAMAGFTPYRF